MHPCRLQIMWACCLAIAVSGGCLYDQPTAVDFGLRRVAATDQSNIIGVIDSTLTGMGYALVQRDVDAGVIEYTDGRVVADKSTGRGLSSSMMQRRMVEFRILSVPDGHKVFCRVSIQRQTTQAHRALAFDRAGDDRPGQTAIDRDAATTTRQNTVWQTYRRDKSTEQTILSAITAKLGRGSNEN